MSRFLNLLCAAAVACSATAFTPPSPSQQYRLSNTARAVATATETLVTEMVDTNHAQFLSDDASKPVLIDMYATWCGPCKLIEPVLDRCADKWESHLDVTRFNVEAENPTLKLELTLKEMMPRKLPTLVLYQNGQPIATRSGLINDDQLDAFLKEHL